MKTNYVGIDYAAGQSVNRNTQTGIRFGVIHQNRLCEFAFDAIANNGVDVDAENYKGECKKSLRSSLSDYFHGEKLDNAVESAFDAISDNIFDNYETGGDCTRYHYDHDGDVFDVASDGDIFVTSSRFFTYAQFCSPCAPGACYLASPLESPSESNKCYCLGAEWFDEINPCPYPIYSVETGKLISAPLS